MVTVWMAIRMYMGFGWQFAFEQWGLNKIASSGPDTINFPIPFSAEPAVAVAPSGSPYILISAGTTSFTGNFTKETISPYIHWIAVGAN